MDRVVADDETALKAQCSGQWLQAPISEVRARSNADAEHNAHTRGCISMQAPGQ